MTTHIHTSFTGLEVETGKQAEGGKLVYSASHSKSEPWLQPIRYPTAATETQREKKNLTYVEMMILRDVMESWLPKSILISNGFLFFLCSNQSTLHWCRLKLRFSDYEAKRRKLTVAISLRYTVKGVLH